MPSSVIHRQQSEIQYHQLYEREMPKASNTTGQEIRNKLPDNKFSK